MALFRTPKENADNPPSTWRVVMVAPRLWALETKDGDRLDITNTKKECERLRTEGFWVALYDREKRHYAGEHVHGWRDYADIEAERARSSPC